MKYVLYIWAGFSFFLSVVNFVGYVLYGQGWVVEQDYGKAAYLFINFVVLGMFGSLVYSSSQKL